MARGGGFHAHPETIEAHASRTEDRASQLHGHAESIGGTSMSGNALGSIGSGLTGSLTSRYQHAGQAVHTAGDRMNHIATTERTNAGNYRESESANESRFRGIMSGDEPQFRRDGHISTDPNTPPPSSGGTKPQSVPTLTGIDPKTGKKVSFTPDQVQSVPLRDSKGNLVGVSFPTKPSDPTAVPAWAGKNRTSDQQFRPAQQTPPANPGAGPGWAFQQPQSTPWSNTGTPVYVHAHANQNSFGVNVNTGTATNPNWQTVGINGETHGQVIAANQHYQQAAGANPNSPLVLMSCSSGKPGGTAAGDAANYLHTHGDGRDVYAPTGTGLRWMDGKGGPNSYYGVAQTTDAAGNTVPGSFRHYPGSPPAPANPTPPSGGGSTP